MLISNILLHVHLLNIREVAKLSLYIDSSGIEGGAAAAATGSVKKKQANSKGGVQEGFNFARIYIEVLKRFEIEKMSHFKSVA